MLHNDPIHRQLLAALQVLTRTPHIAFYLAAHDPKALAQAERAIEATLAAAGPANLMADDEPTTAELFDAPEPETFRPPQCGAQLTYGTTSGPETVCCERLVGHEGTHHNGLRRWS